jgi:hypothetical protein
MSYNTPVRILQGGSVLEVGPSGTVSILAGGSIQNAGGQAFAGSVIVSGSLSVTGVAAAPALTIGGTYGRWAFGTVGIAAGVGTFATGLTRVISANVNPLLGEAQGAGSAVFALVDLSLSGSGSVITRLGSVGGALWNAGGTVAYSAFGT